MKPDDGDEAAVALRSGIGISIKLIHAAIPRVVVPARAGSCIRKTVAIQVPAQNADCKFVPGKEAGAS